MESNLRLVSKFNVLQAIIKDLNSSFGIVASYHRITSVSVNYKTKQVVICVSSYSTKVIRVNNFNPLGEIDIEVPTSDFIQFKDTNVIYTANIWLKANVVGFEDSIDDLDIVEDFVVDIWKKKNFHMSKKEYSKDRIIEIVKGFIGNHTIMFIYFCG